jgi:hypothetical protein
MGVSAYRRAGVCGARRWTSEPLGPKSHHIGPISPISPIHSQRSTPHLTLPGGYTNTYSRRYAHTPTRPYVSSWLLFQTVRRLAKARSLASPPAGPSNWHPPVSLGRARHGKPPMLAGVV